MGVRGVINILGVMARPIGCDLGPRQLSTGRYKKPLRFIRAASSYSTPRIYGLATTRCLCGQSVTIQPVSFGLWSCSFRMTTFARWSSTTIPMRTQKSRITLPQLSTSRLRLSCGVISIRMLNCPGSSLSGDLFFCISHSTLASVSQLVYFLDR